MRELLQVFKALSDETRLRILHLLSLKDLCVCELVDILGMTQSRVSHQLQILKNARLVRDRREGKWIVYSLDTQGKNSYSEVLFALLKKTLSQDERIQEDSQRLKQCLKGNV